MATDMIDSEVVLKAAADNNVMSLNNSPDTPRIYESPGGDIRDTPSLSSHSEDLQNSSTELSLEKGEEAAGAALHRPTQTGGPPQETVTPDNGEKHEERVEMVPCSVPVRIPQTYSTSGHNGSLQLQESVATTEARLRMEGVELKEEWQDEDFPRPLPEEEEEDIQLDEDLFTGPSGEGQSASAGGYSALSGGGKKTKKKLAAPDISLTLDRSEGSLLSDELEEESAELDLDDIDTPSDNSNEFEWEVTLVVMATVPRSTSVTTCRSPRPRRFCRRGWSRSRCTRPPRSGKRGGAGECSV